jgi:uncharacterized damage-inducible protein DinB
MLDEILEAWRINQRVNLRLLARISDAGLACTRSKRGGRTVARQFGHLQYVRVFQLRKRARALAEGAVVFESKEEPAREELRVALEDSARRVEEWLRRVYAGESGARPLRKGLVPTLGYLIAHESHHRGNILLTLKECGHPLERASRDAIWDWNRI